MSRRRNCTRLCEDSVDGIALGACEIVAVHAVAVLDVADDRFDGGTPLHLAFDGGRHAALRA